MSDYLLITISTIAFIQAVIGVWLAYKLYPPEYDNIDPKLLKAFFDE